jgi:hypothetical protein
LKEIPKEIKEKYSTKDKDIQIVSALKSTGDFVGFIPQTLDLTEFISKWLKPHEFDREHTPEQIEEMMEEDRVEREKAEAERREALKKEVESESEYESEYYSSETS